ncbi:MAG: hypothetical protein V1908_02680 [Candidatus Peregrinibacteria bacterium]
MIKIAKTIIEKIKQERRQPRSRWIFVAQYATFWTLSIVSLLAAGMFFGSLLAGLISAKWSLAPRWPGAWMGFLWDAVAWLWVGGALIAIAGGVLFFRLTRRGYRYGMAFIAITLATTGFFAGVFLLQTALPGFFMDWHDRHWPVKIEASRFHTPSEGRLVGKITSVEGDTAYLESADGRPWELWFFSAQKVQMGDDVVVFGEPMDPFTFAVLTLQPVP